MENTYQPQPQRFKTLTDDEQFELRSTVGYLKAEASDFMVYELVKHYSNQIAELCRQFGAQNVEDALRDKKVGVRLPACITRVLCGQLEWWSR